MSSSGSSYAYKWKKCDLRAKEKERNDTNNIDACQITSAAPTSNNNNNNTVSPNVPTPAGEEVKDEVESVVIASEPLYRTAEVWNLVPNNHVVIVTPNHQVILEPIDLKALCASETDPAQKVPSLENLDDADAEKTCQKRRRKKVRPKSALSVMACSSRPSGSNEREKIPFCWGIDRNIYREHLKTKDGEPPKQQTQTLQQPQQLQQSTSPRSKAPNSPHSNSPNNSCNNSPYNSSCAIPTRATQRTNGLKPSSVVNLEQTSVVETQKRFQEALEKAAEERDTSPCSKGGKGEEEQEKKTTSTIDTPPSHKKKKKKKKKHRTKKQKQERLNRPVLVLKLGSLPLFIATLLFNILLFIAAIYYLPSLLAMGRRS